MTRITRRFLPVSGALILSACGGGGGASFGPPADATAPTAPALATPVVASATQVDLGWTAATDAVGVTGYLVERCAQIACSSFTQIASLGGSATTYSDTSVSAATAYTYRVRAEDAAGNLGAYSTPRSIRVDPIPIGAANAQAVTSGVAAALLAGGNLADINLDFSSGDVATLAAPGGVSARLVRGAGALALQAAAAQPSAQSGPTACFIGGTVTLTSTLASSTALTSGDSITATFAQCDNGLGQVDGRLDLLVQDFAGDLANGFFLLDVKAAFSQLQVTAGTDVAIFEGVGNIVVDTRDNVLLYSTLSGPWLAVSLNGLRNTLENYAVTTVTDITNANDYDESLAATGTLTSQALGGRVDLDTVAVLQQAESDNFPRSGQFTIAGAGNTSVDLTVTLGGAVTLDIDADGNGSPESTQNTTWAALFN